MTDREILLNNNSEPGPSSACVPGSFAVTPSASESTEAGSSTEYLASPTTSFNSAISCDKFVSSADFEGFPKAKPRKQNRKVREKATSKIATSTPEKLKLQEKAEKRKAKKSTQLKPKRLFTKKCRKEITDSDEEEEEEEKQMEISLSVSSDESFDLFDEADTDITSQFFVIGK